MAAFNANMPFADEASRVDRSEMNTETNLTLDEVAMAGLLQKNGKRRKMNTDREDS